MNTNPYVGERPLPLQNAKVVGVEVPIEVYLRQAPEVRRGMPQYCMGRSDLKTILGECPEYWIKQGAREDEPEEKDTDSTIWGSMIDCLLLSPMQWPERYACTPATYTDLKTGKVKPRHGSATPCKEWAAAHEDKIVVNPKLQANIEQARAQFGEKPRVKKFLEACPRRQVLVMGEWKHEKATIPVKALIDLVPNLDTDFGNDLADFKTSAVLATGAWPFLVDKYGYDMQAALYLDLWNAATGEKRDSFRHVMQLNKPPWIFGTRILSAAFVEVGRWKLIEAMDRYVESLTSGVWGDYEFQAEGMQIEGWLFVDPTEKMLERYAHKNAA